ncbi:MAG: lyase family protein [Candidatus Marsarchaeota archaeon]|nr:lyase family protein [Candidatus Marsarchaeota archaeon]MCL5413229.1 lyase family protein [Candidatus Marsarchaeota archaeon]
MRPKKLDVSYSENQEAISPIGTRYTTPMSKIFSEDSYMQAILDVEAENVKVLSELYPDKIPNKSAKRIKSIAKTRTVTPKEVRDVEANKTHHEMGAVIRVMSGKAGDDGRYVHFAMTSADAVETAKALQAAKAIAMLIKTASEARDACLRAALEWKDVPSITRTHGQQAIPASFGFPFAFFGYCLQKSIERLKYDREMCVEGKLSGAVGTYDVHTNEGIDGANIEAKVFRNLGVKAAEISLQTPPREDTAYLVSDLAVLCGRIESIAAYVKTLKRTEILELSETPEESSVGSSAMPHKNLHGNPFIEERCMSIARVVRGYALSSMESMLQEDLRDLTASLSDRIVLPESFILSDYSCRLIRNVIERSEVMSDNVSRNLAYTKGATSSQLVMSRLVSKGMQRQKARDISFRDARTALEEGRSYFDILLSDKEISGMFTKKELEELCNPDSNLGRSKEIIDRIARKYLNK